MIVLDCEQYSDTWYRARAGLPSASCFDQIVTSDGKPSKQRRKYLLTLAGERMLGEKVDQYQSAAMARGMEVEAEARAYYELVRGVDVQQVGLIYRDESRRVACSPDGLVGDDGGLEIKCPALHTHVDYLLRGKIPVDYVQQVQGTLWITGRKWHDFLSYFPGIKPLIVRVHPDLEFHAALAQEIDKFLTELDEVSRLLQNA